ncbi:hypothetical protein Csa_002238 [Cucumis sativus]|uniref:Uncharacterized protein n=1 Tax=Cucumis sativus TaxID=3659 RepID=A0A0A0LCQ6_CUCSA|nr:hypothetical protein Csa_002238 [Cucumis sativus]
MLICTCGCKTRLSCFEDTLISREIAVAVYQKFECHQGRECLAKELVGYIYILPILCSSYGSSYPLHFMIIWGWNSFIIISITIVLFFPFFVF